MDVKQTVDKLGKLKSRIAELTKTEKTLTAALAERGNGAYDGDLFRATVSSYEREGRDEAFKALIEQLVLKHTTPQYRRAHTTAVPVTAVRVVARVRDSI